MERKHKILLGLAIVCFLGGLAVWYWVPPGAWPGLNVLMPLSFILFGMFLVTRLLEKEADVAVRDQQQALERAGIHVPRSEVPNRQGAIIAQ